MLTSFVVWAAVVGAGTAELICYSNSPGVGGAAPIAWPKDSQIPFDTQRPTVAMFVHPQCPCSRASLGELETFLTRFPGQLNVHVIFLKPAGTLANWERTGLWRKASSIPGVKVSTDNAGAEASRFHAETSGQTLFYDRNGVLQFQGGITLGRGHAGDNPGRSALQEIMRAGHASLTQTPVFGCSLFEAQCSQGSIICKP
jgi:hypothetical protein